MPESFYGFSTALFGGLGREADRARAPGLRVPAAALVLLAAALSWACDARSHTAGAASPGPGPGPAPGQNAAPASAAPARPPAGTARQELRFDSARAWAHLERQVAFGPRPAGSPAIERTRQYLLDQLAAAGIAARRQPFSARTPLGEVAMANVIATIPGRRPERLALASHYDTKLFTQFRFVGANDGASSTAVVLELGRVLRQRQDNEFTIELIFFDGEEAVVEWRDNDHTYGSRHYVDAARRDGTLTGLKALVLLDMVGDRDLLIRRDANSTPWLTDIIWRVAAQLGYRHVFSDQLTVIEDDHIPFLRAGVPAVDVIDLDNPTWHTPLDDLEHVSQESLQIVGNVILAAVPEIERRLAGRN